MTFTVSNKIWILIAVIVCILVQPPVYADQKEEIPRSVGLVLNKAYGFLDKKEISKAIEILESFQAKGKKNLKPGARNRIQDRKGYTHYLVDFTLGNCYLLSDRMPNHISKAASHYNSAIKKKPDFSPAWLNLARCHYELNRPEQAGICFLTAYDTADEKKPEILFYSATSFMAAEDNENALKVLKRLLSSHKDRMKIEWKESLVQVYLAVNQPYDALPLIEELATKTGGKKKKQWQKVLLHQYLSLNMNAKALDYARQLTREYPLEFKWWKALAHLHLMENRYEKGLVALTVYSHLTPLTDQEKRLLADLNLTLGIPIQAALLYEEILSKNMDIGIVEKLAESYLSLHRPQDALQWVEKGLGRSPETKLLMLKGNLLYDMKKYPEAMVVFESIPRYEHSGHEHSGHEHSGGEHSGQALLMAGYSAWNAGNMDRAQQAFKKASHYSKQRKTARKLLRQLEKATHQKD